MSNTIRLGQKIIYKKPVNEKIVIQVDKPALRRLSYLFLAAFAIIAFRAAAYSAWDMSNLTLLLAVLIPYLMYWVYYYYTRTNSTWYVDLKEKRFFLGTIAVPFFMIERLRIEKKEKWQLYLETKDKKRLMLFNVDTEQLIREAAQFLAQKTGAPLKN
ncbi:MAG TPA: hypothetical protein VD905_18405 [Flavobacteriales bacterium]|nr:hypothetical protein [Flavobacteriales bacterium]